MKEKILIIEDETKYAYILEKFFTANDFEVLLAFDGLNGIKMFNEHKPDLICLDIMLPKMNGWEIAERIREVSDVPIVMMSALSDESDILKGYSLKIDDYVTKPFRTPILIAKVKNLLERRKTIIEKAKETSINDEKEIYVGKIKLSVNSMQCFINGEQIKLTKTEFKILEYLATNIGKNCTREQILNAFWDNKEIDGRIIDTYIKKLRKIVIEGNCEIVTAFGIGYRFEERE